MRAATGMRALWERQQRAAELAAVADRIPTLARSKPAFLAAQLRPVLAALQLVAAQRQEQQAGEEPAGPEAEQQMAAAAAHLRRLVGIDRQAGANASLLLWLLLESSVAGDESELQGGWGSRGVVAGTHLPRLPLQNA